MNEPKTIEELLKVIDDSAKEIEKLQLENEFLKDRWEEDTAERTLKETQLKESLELLRKITNQVPGVVYQFRMKPDGTASFPYASDTVKQYFGITPDEAREDISKVFALIHPDDYKGVESSIYISGKSLTPWQHEYRVKLEDGEIHWMYGNALPQREEDGSMLWHGFITDITKQKQVEEALGESETRFQTLANIAPVLIWMSGEDALCDYFNKVWLDFTGRTAEQELGNGWAEGVHPDDFDRCLDIYLSSFNARKPFKMEYRLRRYDGEYRWVMDNAVPRYTPDGAFVGFIGSCVDITDERTAEQALRESEAKHSSMISNISDVIAVIGLDGLIKYKSPNIEKWFGWKPNDLVGMDAWLTVHPDDLERIQKEFFMLLATPNQNKTVEYRYKCKDGNYKWIELTAVNLADDPSINGVLLNYREITERKAAADALQKEKTRLAVILKGTNVGSWEWNVQTGEVIFNERWAEMIGYTLSEISPVSIETWVKYTDPEDLKISGALLERHFKGESDYYECEARMKHKNGTWVWVLDRGQVHTWDENGKPLLMSGTHQDISRKKQFEKEIESKNEQLTALNAAKDKLFSIISHDLKSPIHGFLGITQMMFEKAYSFSPAKLAEYGKLLHQTASNLFSLLKNLLEWAQMQDGSISFQPKEISLYNLITENAIAMKARAQQKEITIITKAAGGLEVYADEKMVNSILLNLLSNAVKFTQRNGTITVQVEQTDDETYTISVTDTGIGIPKESVKKLFTIGEKVTSLGTEGEESTGLGLVLCKEFVEKNGGRIWVHSEEGKGSVFSFTLKKRM